MSTQKLEEIQEFKITFKDEFLLEYYRLMSKFLQFKRNFLKKYLTLQANRTFQMGRFA